MRSYNYLSDVADCSEMVDFLVGEGNKDLVVFLHEVGPVTTIRYKGNLFSLKYNKDHFARVSMDTGCKESVSVDSLFELGEIVSRMIGNPTVYYDMSFKKSGIEKINPTLDWCLEKDLVDHYISDIINGRMFDDGGKCLNVRVFDEKINDNSKKRLQLILK